MLQTCHALGLVLLTLALALPACGPDTNPPPADGGDDGPACTPGGPSCGEAWAGTVNAADLVPGTCAAAALGEVKACAGGCVACDPVSVCEATLRTAACTSCVESACAGELLGCMAAK